MGAQAPLASHCFQLVWVICLEVELQGHMGIVYLRNRHIFSQMAASLYGPMNNAQEFQFLSVLAISCYFKKLFHFYTLGFEES